MYSTSTVGEQIDIAGAHSPDKDVFLQAETGDGYTYEEAINISNKIANALRERGIKKGDRVAFATQLTPEYAVSWIGATKIGAVPVPLHLREPPQRLEKMVSKVEPTAIFFEDSLFDDIEEAVQDIDFRISHAEGSDNGVYFGDFISGVSSDSPSADVKPTDDACIFFSSGSTGLPKPVVHTHSSIVEGCKIGYNVLDAKRTDVNLNAFPSSFAAFVTVTFPYVFSGGSVVLMREWNPTAVPELIESMELTTMTLSPTQYRMLFDENDLSKYDTSSLEKVGCGGEYLPPDLHNNIQREFTDEIYLIYGSSETLYTTVLLPKEVSKETLNSVGKPGPGVQVTIVDPTKNDPYEELEKGKTGKVAVCSPSMADRIFNSPELTDDTFVEGWWLSGDAAQFDDDGYLHLEGRVDNMIISGGMNVYAENVEEVIEQHPDVLECAVVGVPHEKWGEAVEGHVVGDVSEEELDTFCREKLADYEVPKSYVFKESLPRTSTGKLNRDELKNVDMG